MKKIMMLLILGLPLLGLAGWKFVPPSEGPPAKQFFKVKPQKRIAHPVITMGADGQPVVKAKAPKTTENAVTPRLDRGAQKTFDEIPR